MRWFYGLLAVAGSMLFGAVMLDVAGWARGLLLAGGMVAGALALQVKCPRCKLHISGHRYGNYWPGTEPSNRPCPQCGHSRLGVWPLQYARSPEPWDGQRPGA